MVVIVSPIKDKSLPQIYCILTVCINTLVTGQLLAWPSPSIPLLISEDNPYQMSIEDASYVTIIPAIASMVAAPFVGKLIDLIGRKYALLSVTLSHILAWTFTAIGGPSYIYYISRVFVGIGDACVFSTIPCYVSEVSTPKVRGTWGNCVSLSIFLGQLIANIVGAYLSIRKTAFVSLTLPLLFLLNFHFLPESPYYLLMKDRGEEARNALRWLRGRQEVDEELRQLDEDVKRQMSELGRFKDLITIESNRKALLVGVLIRTAQQYSGIAAFAMYAQMIFINSGSQMSASTSAILFSGFLFACSSIAALLLDVMGRRIAMLTSSSGCCLVLFLQAVFYYLKDVMLINFEGAFDLFPLISMIAFVFVFALGLGTVPTLMLGELFSSSIKSNAFIVTNVFFGLAVATSTQIFTTLVTNFGLYPAYLFLAICSFVNIFISYFLIPETKGRTLEEIQQNFKL